MMLVSSGFGRRTVKKAEHENGEPFHPYHWLSNRLKGILAFDSCRTDRIDDVFPPYCRTQQLYSTYKLGV